MELDVSNHGDSLYNDLDSLDVIEDDIHSWEEYEQRKRHASDVSSSSYAQALSYY